MPADCRRYGKNLRRIGTRNRKICFCFIRQNVQEKNNGGMEKGCSRDASRFDNRHQIIFVPAQAGFRRHYSRPRKFLGLQKSKKPYADARKAAEIISRKAQARLIFGDELIRTETFYRQESGEFSPSFARQSRLVGTAEQIIIDAKEYFEEKKTNQRKFVSTPQLVRTMDEAAAKNEKIIIFANRKGYNPTTLCADCHRTILCEKCAAPVVMRKTDSKMPCKSATNAWLNCPRRTVAHIAKAGDWNLTALERKWWRKK